ncbi:hypothetical protein BJ138DRAFT_625398 [Hygrophoropsis aurantiaca]|uniref:Uncharacterized protein n=1 Tax=Hygrophoropsis aurantiaca TaxID=72124 RepID=A0ACB8AKM8_9AGAM|nr:hypothetical protein BJ138DRAFT_625398 [Hygrophoropsis aurantiaca]
MTTLVISTPSPQCMSVSGKTRDLSMPPLSPSCRVAHYNTPPRLSADNSDSAPSYDSPMLTPSPLRRRPLFPPPVDHSDQDDIFLQSPFKSPPPIHRLYTQHRYKQQPVPIDDDEGSIFLSSSSAAPSPFFPPPSSQPLRTPVKESSRIPARHALSNKQLNVHQPVPSSSAARIGIGTKRKSSAQSGGFSTPVRQSVSTPLSISASKTFHRLAPLPAPRFLTRTPQSKAETEAYMSSQTETLKKLRIRDMVHSDEEWGVVEDDSDSGCEVGEDQNDRGDELFLDLPSVHRAKPSSLSPKKPLHINVVPQKGSAKEEVTEAISPGGHIIKRRARSRPVSLELLESANQTPSPPAYSQSAVSNSKSTSAVTFPTVSLPTFGSSKPLPFGGGSPMPRRRLTGGGGPSPFCKPRPAESNQPRAPFNRLPSSATLFFGPSIPQPTLDSPQRSSVRPRTNTGVSNSAASVARAAQRAPNTGPSVASRHSYAGPGNMSPLPWRVRSGLEFSPDSSPQSLPGAHEDIMDDDMLFEPCGPQDSSFVFNITEGTPSPRSKKGKETLPTKYKPRDSGVVLGDEEDLTRGDEYLSTVPRASTSASSIYSDDAADDLVTPGFGPTQASGWPTAIISSGLDDRHINEGGVDVEAFILRTLAAGGKGSAEETKKPPGTPVKKLKNVHLGANRPWQSAVAAKVAFNFGFDLGAAPGKPKNAPRKSLPAAFPVLGGKKGKAEMDGSDSDDDEENSPSSKKDARYDGLGLGRPPMPSGPPSAVSRTRWLMRRSSSGAFSSGSETSIATPTRRKDWPLPPRAPLQSSPGNKTLRLAVDNASSRSSSNSSVISLNSPTLTRRQLPGSATQIPHPSPLVPPNLERLHKPGRFEKEFVEIDQIGSGEFGKVMKVRAKNGAAEKVWAVKRSKPFEGPRHRLRLREEVDILQHLSQAAASNSSDQGQHPNVLGFIDSWEQDETLFIRTELCELGNFSRFLWEYGKAFPRLGEAKVWKIFVDLSNVSTGPTKTFFLAVSYMKEVAYIYPSMQGLRFIHHAGVIHLDLKPANIFLTRDGRFKIGDFGMASHWPRPNPSSPLGVAVGGFEREGDKVYLAREVLHGTYGKAADIFSFGMVMLETATNIVVPDHVLFRGDGWHRLRQEDFSQVDLDGSPELFELIKGMMRMDPARRLDIDAICRHPVVSRARAAMERMHAEAKALGTPLFGASPLASVQDTFLEQILGRRTTSYRHSDDYAMDLSP